MRTKTMTAAQLAEISRKKSHILGWTKYVCTLDPDEQEPLEVEGYNDAVDNYEVWRDAAIREFDQRHQ